LVAVTPKKEVNELFFFLFFFFFFPLYLSSSIEKMMGNRGVVNIGLLFYSL